MKRVTLKALTGIVVFAAVIAVASCQAASAPADTPKVKAMDTDVDTNAATVKPGATQAAGPAVDLNTVLDKVETERQKVKRLEANVIKDREIPALERVEKWTGTLKFQMPRQLRLELQNAKKDRSEVYVVGEKYAWVYRPEAKKAERFTLAEIKKKQEGSDNPFDYGLAVDLRELQKKYVFTPKPDAWIGKRPCAVIELTPRPEAKSKAHYDKLEFWIDKALWLPVRVVQWSSEGEEKVTYTLTDVVVNPNWTTLLVFNKNYFDFSPPGDVDVVEHELSGGVQ